MRQPRRSIGPTADHAAVTEFRVSKKLKFLVTIGPVLGAGHNVGKSQAFWYIQWGQVRPYR
jgi:hypothetical protein